LDCSLLRLNVTIPRHAGINERSFLALDQAPRPLQGKSPYVFTTEQGTPGTTAWFLRMVQRAQGELQSFPFLCIYTCCAIRLDTSSLTTVTTRDPSPTISAILQSTARYTALAPNRFARFWQD
jgi:hypothetical protein